VVLLSGGMDSATLLHAVARNPRTGPVWAISIHYGQKHSRELAAARWQARAAGVREHRVVDLACLGALLGNASALTGRTRAVPDLAAIAVPDRDQPPTYVPNRNMILLSLAAAWAEAVGASRVFYGAQRQDEYGYWDCTRAFVARLNSALALNRRRPVRVVAPFVAWSKARVLKKGLELGVDYSHTWSCYRGGRKPCGACPSCVERARAFRSVGMGDPLIAPR
jgi:7-cyano-7-deazaguanine synthase